MISKKFGFLQGRLSKPRSKKILHFFPAKNWKKEISLAKNMGFTYIEYCNLKKFNKKNPIWSKGGLKQVKFLSKKFKLKNFSMNDDFFVNKDLIKYKNVDGYFDELVKKLTFLKIKLYVLALHEKSAMTNENYRDYAYIIKRISKKFKKNRIALSLETNFEANYILKFFRIIDDNNTFLVYDTGNRFKKNHNQYLEILKLRKKINHVQFKDKNFFGQSVPIGEGKVNFVKIIKSLKKIHYKGNFTFENHRGEDPVVTMRKNLTFMKKIMKNTGYKI